MNKVLGVLILLGVFLGLGISCASAANTVSFNPQTVVKSPGSSQAIQIVMDSIPGGLSGFNITISILNPEIAEITAVSFPGWNAFPRNSTLPSSSVWIKGLDIHNVEPGASNVLLGTITLRGKKAGTTDLGITKERIDNETGSPIKYSVIPGAVQILDIESPVIKYVSLSSNKPLTGDSIVVTVNATDNVGVSGVKVNDIQFLNHSGNIWSGNIIALQGTHSVNVSAVDGAGNVAWNNSTSYTAVTPDIKPPSSITNLQSTSGTTWIKWTWQNPNDADFNHTEIYLNGIFRINTSAGFFNATGLQPEKSYTISTRTADNSGNVNQTWVNASAKTAPVPDTISPVIKSVVLFPTSTTTGSTINVTVNVTDNVGVSTVKANNTSLLYQGGNIWNGSISALQGTHFVNISAVDGAGNVAWNNSTSYKAVTPDNIPPSSITNLQFTGGTTWIKWTWTNPRDVDFNYTQIYLNGIFKTNTSAGYFNATGLQPDSSYTISTRTVDTSSNVNQTWVNTTSKTLSLPDTTSPAIKSVVLFPTSATTGSTINVTVNVTDNIGVSTVKANNTSLLYQGGSIWNGSISALKGTHFVNVSAMDRAGNVAWNNSTTYTALPVPVALKINDFTASITSGKAPLSTEFRSNVSGTNITKWRWDFEPSGKDTYSQHAVTAKHIFTRPGIYDITLTVWDAAGQTATLTKPAYVMVSSADTVKKPVANFAASVSSGKAPLTVKFTDKSTNKPTSWKWNFGDGTASADKNPSHAYKKKGKYTVSLTVKNTAGSGTAAKSGLITVK